MTTHKVAVHVLQHSPERGEAGKLINSNPSDVSNSGLGEK